MNIENTFNEKQIEEYNKYKREHIAHHNECPMCRTDSIISSLYHWYRECPSCRNSSWEGYPFQPKKPISIEEFFNIWKEYTNIENKSCRHCGQTWLDKYWDECICKNKEVNIKFEYYENYCWDGCCFLFWNKVYLNWEFLFESEDYEVVLTWVLEKLWYKVNVENE